MLVETLSQRSGVSTSKISRVAATASKRYKVYTIPKRSGGTRLIEHPSRELKAIQRWLSAYIIDNLNVHASATAYQKGCSIGSNARIHANSNFTLRLDFKDFFPSFKSEHVFDFIKSAVIIGGAAPSDEDASFCAAIFCRHGRVTIGAPSSPKLTNAMMFEFDRHLFDFFSKIDITYSRYADDLYISSSNHFDHKKIKELVAVTGKSFPYLDLTLNEEKTAFSGRSRRRTIAGLFITSTRKVSLGRARKRMIHSLVHKATIAPINTEDRLKIAGWISFALDAEPSFVEALTRKYGVATISMILGRNGVPV